MKSINNSIRALVILLIVLLFIFTEQNTASNNEIIKISADPKTGFTLIEINNLSGRNVSIIPLSDKKGSIGFEQKGKINWLKGKPEESAVSNEKTTYTWRVEDGNRIFLEVGKSGDDLALKLYANDNNEPSITNWYLNFAAENNEYFTGIFERVVDGHQNESWKDGISETLNLRGQKVDVKLKPTVSAYAPFYISSNNYGFFVKGTWPGVIDFCKEFSNTVQISFEGPELDFKIYRGTSPLQIVQKHALETGPSFVPPQWAFGPWRWRDEHKNRKQYYEGTEVKAPYNSEIVEDVLMMKAFGIPCTAYWIDRPWGPGDRGYDDFLVDTERLPQFESMIKWLNKNNMELMIWIAPFVMGKMADYAEEHNYYLISRPRGNARQVLLDFTNPDAVKWWGENGPAKLAKMGIKGFKLDRADGEKLLDSLHLKTFAGTTYRENYNDYARQYVKATYDAVKPVLGSNFLLYPRVQYTGSAKYGGLWAGDTDGKAEGLRSAIIAMQRCAIMGYPIWGSDTGGYWGKFSHETTMRWLGFSCFSPLMEVGPTNNEGFWNNPTEPKYDVQLLASWRLYTNLRMKIKDYVNELAIEANKNGIPVARPLFLTYPDQKESWNDWQTYTLGNDILVSAIWESGIQKHKLYLPAGQEWIDAWNPGNVIDGGKYVEVDAPLYKIPVFIRKGSKIDLGDLNKLYEESVKIVSQKPNLEQLEKQEGWR